MITLMHPSLCDPLIMMPATSRLRGMLKAVEVSKECNVKNVDLV
jgi:hypothetical protein